MKHLSIILMLSIASIGITTFGFMSGNNCNSCLKTMPFCVKMNSGAVDFKNSLDFDFSYKIDSRFMSTITKDEVKRAQTLIEIVKRKDHESIISYSNIEVKTFYEKSELETKILGDNEFFTDSQLELLHNIGYGANFFIGGNIKKINEISGEIETDTLIHYITVIPTSPVAYDQGDESLISYLRENSQDIIEIARRDKIQPGKISFKVTKDGDVDQVKLTNGSGYKPIDEKMLKLVQDIPGRWKVAINAQGEKVDQELVFFFGIMGC